MMAPAGGGTAPLPLPLPCPCPCTETTWICIGGDVRLEQRKLTRHSVAISPARATT